MEIRRHLVRLGRGQVDLVDDREHFQVGVEGQVEVGQRLRLDPLRGVNHQDGPFAGFQRAADLVAEVDVPRRIDQVHLVGLAVEGAVAHADRRGLDRDPLLAFQVHRVEDLLRHLPIGNVPVSCSRRSARVDFPWSMWAMMQKLRMWDVSMTQREYTRQVQRSVVSSQFTTEVAGCGRKHPQPVIPRPAQRAEESLRCSSVNSAR